MVFKGFKIAFALLIIDLAAFYTALTLAYLTRKLLNFLPIDLIEFTHKPTDLLRLWWIPLIYIFFIAFERLYTKRLPLWDEVRDLIKAVTLAAVVVFAIVSLGKMTEQVSRLLLLLLWFYSLFLFPLFRMWGKRLLYRLGLWPKSMLIIGSDDGARKAAATLMSDRHTGYKIIGFLDDNGGEIEVLGRKIPVLGRLAECPSVIETHRPEAVLIAKPALEKDELEKLTREVHKRTKRLFVLPDLEGLALLNSELYHLFMQQLFMIKINNNLNSTFNMALKRSFDIFLAILLTPVLLPLIAIVAAAIKLDSKGPVFFVHKRVGRGGKPIGVIKFRTMHSDAQERLEKILESDFEARVEWENSFKLKDDPRITRVGRFLRKTSLDELPQIFNVIRGDMSFVGPRPVVPEEIERYYKEYAEYYYMVRPGITGLWQVSGRSDTGYDLRVRLDTWYVLNWSLWLDVVMLLKTVKVVFEREGAY